ncbi:MAG: hypothetical protein MUC87_18425 [Bacteroidia bacterium]|jgi:hypothetical protein|nr:hypothetical protein [Bacteroidia bacterium]
MTNQKKLSKSPRSATTEIQQHSVNELIKLTIGIDYEIQPRYLLLAMRLMSFGYSTWLHSPKCKLPETYKKVIRHYRDTLNDNPDLFQNTRLNGYNRAGLNILNYYPDYQNWLYSLTDSEELYHSPHYEKYRLISSPLKFCPYLTKESAIRMRNAGIYSLYQMLLTLTYPEIRERAYISKKEAQKLFPRLYRLGLLPAAEKKDLIVSADQLSDAVFELTAKL